MHACMMIEANPVDTYDVDTSRSTPPYSSKVQVLSTKHSRPKLAPAYAEGACDNTAGSLIWLEVGRFTWWQVGLFFLVLFGQGRSYYS